MSEARIIPGAPPPPPLTKSQLKKKRKTKAKATEPSPVEIADSTAAALVEKAPEATDIKEGAVAPELVAQVSQSESQTVDDASLTLSPIVDLVNKRLKATNKKITRITLYTTADAASLNEDQKRAVSSLPALEAISKELLEVKKAVETHEAELAVELAGKRRAAEEAERIRVSEAVSAAEALNVKRAANLLSFVRMRSLSATGELDLFSLGVSQEEVDSVHAAGAILLGNDTDATEAVIHGFLSDGQFEGIPYSRFLEICDQVFSPPPPVEVPAPTTDEPLEEVVSDEPVEAEVTPEISVPMTASSSFHFMQASELDTPSFEVNTEWVEAADIAEDSETAPEVNGHVEETPAREVSNEPIDWAAEGEDELPPIDNLHATFGKSGSATPTVQPEIVENVTELATNGQLHQQPTSAVEEEDGFTQARGGRGRGGGRGFRGGDRGGRGGFRGNGFRGGERGRGGGYRGRGDWRGGDGEFRGGRGEWRGGDGEFRGRGRGRGRGGFAPPSQA